MTDAATGQPIQTAQISIGGTQLGISLTGIQAYAAAKAAQIGLTRQLAHELGPFGISVNNVAPGLSFPTSMIQEFSPA